MCVSAYFISSNIVVCCVLMTHVFILSFQHINKTIITHTSYKTCLNLILWYTWIVYYVHRNASNAIKDSSTVSCYHAQVQVAHIKILSNGHEQVGVKKSVLFSGVIKREGLLYVYWVKCVCIRIYRAIKSCIKISSHVWSFFIFWTMIVIIELVINYLGNERWNWTIRLN